MRTAIRVTCSFAAVLLSTVMASNAATVDYHPQSLNPHMWEVVGNNPCKGTELCTDAWALDQAEKSGVFPDAVADQFRQQLADGVMPVTSKVCPGDQFFITYVKDNLARFTPYAEAAFIDEKCRTILVWYAIEPATGFLYRYFIVLECGNKGGGSAQPLLGSVTIDPLLTGYSSGDDGAGCLCDVVPPSFGFGGYFEEGSQVVDNNDDPETLDPYDKVPAIALPDGLLLLITALAALACLCRRCAV